MTSPTPPSLKRTALHPAHVAAGGRMVPFAGWEMPLQYAGILAEARAVRSACGLFDVSHMGRLSVTGPSAAALLDRVLTQRVEPLRRGQARYGFLLNQGAGIIDDTLVYRLEDPPQERLLLVCNAGNREEVVEWLHDQEREFPSASLADTTLATVMIAVQGPGAVALLEPRWPKVRDLRPFASIELDLPPELGAGRLLAARTGYTGEDGFELIASSEAGPALWRALAEGATPCGLGARDLLRLEAGLSLHGSDIDATTTPLEAGLERFVPLDRKGEFVGRDALLSQRAAGVRRRLVGLTLEERGIPRHGYPIMAEGEVVGNVTSGGFSPALDTGIALGYVAVEHAAPGAAMAVDLRGRPARARVVELPFYRRS